MGRISKKRKEVNAKFDLAKAYSLAEACNLVKEISTTKFDASVAKGVGCLRQQDGGHGSRNPLRSV